MIKKLEELIKLSDKFIELTASIAEEKEEEWFYLRNNESIFNPALVVWLMLLKAIYQTSSAGVLALIDKGVADGVLKKSKSQKANLKKYSNNTGGFSKAQSRLPKEDVEDVCEVIIKSILKDSGKERMGAKVVSIDGTTLCLENTKDILEEYEQGSNQHGTIYHPEVRMLLATEIDTGVAFIPKYAPVVGKFSKSEQELAGEVFNQADKDTTFVGDRNFGVFSVVSAATTQGHKVLFRLTEARAKKFLLEEKKIGLVDKQVTWKASSQDKMLNSGDTTTVTGRFIRITIEQDGFRPVTLFFFTTLTGTVEEILSLYNKRQHIETDIRHFKYLFKMERLNVKSRDMVAKEILLRVASYNLIRSVIVKAAPLVNLAVRKISFERAARVIVIYGELIFNAPNRKKKDELMEKFLIRIRQCRLPDRKRKRLEPRKVTRIKRTFPLFKNSREHDKYEILKKLHIS